ncbi:MAG TPA: VOC family protein [Acidimicrobiales bacterium]|nr:VOC family protein [Acidimicrobiales bacterium]
MPTRTEYKAGTPSWIDLMTTDVAAAQEFYGRLFGWEYVANPTEQGTDYIMAFKKQQPVSGMAEQPAEQSQAGIPPMWNTYVSVDDLEATVAKVEAAGGSVMMPPMKVEDAGTMAVIVDPAGAVVCCWQKIQHAGAGLVNEDGALIWNELITPDPAAVTGFYSEVFGWQPETMTMDGNDYTVMNVDGEGVAGAMATPAEGIPPHWGVYFAVDDCDGCVAAAREAGGQILMPPMDTPVGRMAAIMDPQGATFSVMTPAEPPG